MIPLNWAMWTLTALGVGYAFGYDPPQWWRNFRFAYVPAQWTETQMGARILTGRVTLPGADVLRTSWDCDEYKRWALRSKLRQAGLISPALVTEGGYRASFYYPSMRRQRELRHDNRVFRRYEARVLPNPFVRAMTSEMEGFIVDLKQLETRLFNDVASQYPRRVPFWRQSDFWWTVALSGVGGAIGSWIAAHWAR